MKVAIIGGGASGFFAAIQVKENYPKAKVVIFEKTSKVLSKVIISGGGRCNVTNAARTNEDLLKAYPRGKRMLKSAFYQFNNHGMMEWLESKGVALTIQQNLHVFPKTQNSQTIIDCFISETNRLGIEIKLNNAIKNIISNGDTTITLSVNSEKFIFDKVIVATGGSPKRKNLEWLEKLGHKIENPVPSLFTFNMPNEIIKELMGVVVPNVQVKIQGTKLTSTGDLLITHWGMSGPAILLLSAFGARILAEKEYQFKIQVNWINRFDLETVKEELNQLKNQNSKKQIQKIKAFNLPSRLWVYLLEKLDINPSKKWAETGTKTINKLINILTNDVYQVSGKTTFKEEFVTCGGISLKSIDTKTLQSKAVKNLYFTGEIIDVDGITGGFNFQAAWSTAFVAAKLN